MSKTQDVETVLNELLDEIDDKAQELNRERALELIERLRDELNLRAYDFDGYFREAR